MGTHRARLLLFATFATFAGLSLGVWAAGTASANCNLMPDDPMCQPPPTSPPHTSPPQTSPPHTSPPATQHSPSGVQTTNAPVNRTPATNPTRRAPAVNTYQPPVNAAPDSNFVDTPALIAPAPAIALSGTPPVVGGGVASIGADLPAASSGPSGAGTVLWGFGIAAGAVGIGLGARTLLNPPPHLDVGLDVFYTKLYTADGISGVVSRTQSQFPAGGD
jgi:hypothetical protein